MGLVDQIGDLFLFSPAIGAPWFSVDVASKKDSDELTVPFNKIIVFFDEVISIFKTIEVFIQIQIDQFSRNRLLTQPGLVDKRRYWLEKHNTL